MILDFRNMLTEKKTIASATVLCDTLKPVIILSNYLQGDVHFSRVNTKVKISSRLSLDQFPDKSFFSCNLILQQHEIKRSNV